MIFYSLSLDPFLAPQSDFPVLEYSIIDGILDPIILHRFETIEEVQQSLQDKLLEGKYVYNDDYLEFRSYELGIHAYRLYNGTAYNNLKLALFAI